MAAYDLERMDMYKPIIMNVAKTKKLDPAVIAGIISRETRAGTRASGLIDGWGDEGNAFGLMQVDQRYHKPTGEWDSEEHIHQATDILIRFIKKIQDKFPDWSAEDHFKGGIAAYNAGPGNVCCHEGMDCQTTGSDYANDVVARAQFFQCPVENIFPGLPHSSDKNEEGALADERDYRIHVNTSKDYVIKLENRVMALENLLCEIRMKCDHEHWGYDPLKEKYEDVLTQKEELQLELEQKRQTHSTLNEKYDHMIKQKEDLQRQCEQGRQAHNILKEAYEDVIKQNEALRQGSELIFQTERANNLEKILYSVIRESERKSEELEQEQRAYKIFKEKYEEEQYEDLLK
ncbi:lysozyme g-like isoform X1, partial [Clarias magur]